MHLPTTATAIILCLLAAPLSGSAQSVRGQLRDAAGKPTAAARVTVINADGGRGSAVRADSAGAFELPLVAPESDVAA